MSDFQLCLVVGFLAIMIGAIAMIVAIARSSPAVALASARFVGLAPFRLAGFALSTLSVIPYRALPNIRTAGDWTVIVIRAMAVIVSPAAFALALYHNAEVIGTQSPFLFLVPLVVFATDWMLMAMSTTGRRSVGLWALRIGIILLSLTMAFGAGVMQYSDSIVKDYVAVEDSHTRDSVAFKEELAERDRLTTELSTNVAALAADTAKRLELNNRIIENQRLKDKECGGASRVDQTSGTWIVGGKCGYRANDFTIDAQAARDELRALPVVPDQTQDLGKAITAAGDRMDTLIVAGRGNKDSIATLITALLSGVVSAGVWPSVIFTVIIMSLMEFFAFVMASVPFSDTLRQAIDQSGVRDRVRLKDGHDFDLAELAAERRRKRDIAGSKVGELIAPIQRPLRLVEETERRAGNG